MDKLPEPEYQTDKNWKRLLLGLNEERSKQEIPFYKTFIALSALTCYKYFREVTFYQKNYMKTIFVLSGFVFTSYQIALSKAYTPFLLAAEKNNENEKDFISKYKALYKEAKAKQIEVPDHLLA